MKLNKAYSNWSSVAFLITPQNFFLKWWKRGWTFKTRNLSTWYSDGGYVSLYACPNPKNVQHQEWTLMQTMDLGGLWCSNVGLTKIPLWWETDVEDVCACMGVGVIWKISVPSAQLSVNRKLLKRKMTLKTKKTNKKQLSRVELLWLKCMESTLLIIHHPHIFTWPPTIFPPNL